MSAKNKPSDQLQINFAELDYASDTITMKDLRRLFPQGFVSGELLPYKVPFFNPGVSDDFSTLLDFERLLAAYAFDEAIGRSVEQETVISREEVRDIVEELYIGYGCAKGPTHARQLIRSLEAEAAKQAISQVPGRRP